MTCMAAVLMLLAQENAADLLKRDAWRAVEAFVEKGEAARVPLRDAAGSQDRDAAFYAAAALAAIDMLDDFPDVPRTKALEGRAANVAAGLFKSANLTLSTEGLEDRKVSLPGGLAFDDAVDRLSRELDVEFIERDKTWGPLKPYRSVPRFASGRVGARLEAWSRRTFLRLGAPATQSLTLKGSLNGFGRFRAPPVDSGLLVLEAVDDQGHDLRRDNGSLGTQDEACAGTFFLDLADASTIARLRLAAVFHFEKKRGDIAFDKILEAKNVKKTVGDVTVTVRRVEPSPAATASSSPSAACLAGHASSRRTSGWSTAPTAHGITWVLEHPSAATKARLDGIVDEIEHQERLTFCTGRARRVSLKADRMAMKDVLAELRKQAPTPVVLKGVGDNEPVSVDFKDALFFEALDRICRAHGGICARLPSDRVGFGAPISLEKGDPQAMRRHVERGVAIDVTGVSLTQSGDFTGTVVENMSIAFAFGGESDVRPIDARLVVDSLVDDQGVSYEVQQPSHMDRASSGIPPVSWFSARVKRMPPPSVKRFREVSGTLELTFPSDVHVARIERPLGRKDVEARGGPASFTLREFIKEGDEHRATLDTERAPDEAMSDRVRFEVVDEAGRIYGNTGGHGRSTDAKTMRYTYPFEVPDVTQIAELRAVRLTLAGGKVIKRTIKWTMKDVPFR